MFVVALLNLPAGVAHASSGIEGVWSFGGGAVAVEEGESGAFQGTVVQPTTFAVCEHPVGQEMWTGVRERPDGSFWGRHVWYHGSSCAINPDQGLTAFRVLSTAEGGRILLVCFSNPGDTSQPTIAPDGQVAGATYGCVESAPLAGAPGSSGSKIGFDEILGLPAAQPAPTCRRTLSLIPHNPKYDPLARVTVRIGGKKVADVMGSKALHRPISLTHLPEGRFRFHVLAITVLKQRFSRSGVYRGCKEKVHLHGARRPA
jgi:hypothetical protein